jgi:hypothetical protein
MATSTFPTVKPDLPIYKSGNLSLKQLAKFIDVKYSQLSKIAGVNSRTIERDLASAKTTKKIQPLIPESTRQVVFLGDGEFDGTDLQKTLNDFDWKYVCRTSSNITIYAGDEPFQIDTLAAMLPKGCYKRLRNKLRINNTVLLQLLLGGAMIKKSHCFLLPISLLDRKPVITTQSALPSKRFSAIRKAVGSTSIKAIYLARSD